MRPRSIAARTPARLPLTTTTRTTVKSRKIWVILKTKRAKMRSIWKKLNLTVTLTTFPYQSRSPRKQQLLLQIQMRKKKRKTTRMTSSLMTTAMMTQRKSTSKPLWPRPRLSRSLLLSNKLPNSNRKVTSSLPSPNKLSSLPNPNNKPPSPNPLSKPSPSTPINSKSPHIKAATTKVNPMSTETKTKRRGIRARKTRKTNTENVCLFQ